MEDEASNSLNNIDNQSKCISITNEWSCSLLDKIEFTSQNNGIKETLEFNIYNTNDFSFCEEEKDNMAIPPINPIKPYKNYNYKTLNYKKKKKSNNEDKEEAMIRNIIEISEYKEKKRDLFLGMFSREDFDLNSNMHLNNSFREPYQNPLCVDNEDEENKDKDKDKEKDISKEEKRTDLAPKKEKSDKENEDEEEIIDDNNDNLRNIILKNENKEKDKLKENIIVNEIEKDDHTNSIKENNSNMNDNTNCMFNQPNECNTNQIQDEKIDKNSQKLLNDEDIIDKEEINPLEEEKETIQQNKEEAVKDQVKEDNPNDEINNIYANYLQDQPMEKNDIPESLHKISELTEKLEKSESQYRIAQEKNNKLLEVINIFKVLQSIDNKTSQNNNTDNSNNNKPEGNIKLNKSSMKHQSKSLEKGKGKSNDYCLPPDYNKLYIDYVQTNHKTYVQIYNKNNRQRHRKNSNSKKYYEVSTLNKTYCENTECQLYSINQTSNNKAPLTKIHYVSNSKSKSYSKEKNKSHPLSDNCTVMPNNCQSYINIPNSNVNMSNNSMYYKESPTKNYNSNKEDCKMAISTLEKSGLIKLLTNPKDSINNNNKNNNDNNTDIHYNINFPFKNPSLQIESKSNDNHNNINWQMPFNPSYHNNTKEENDQYWNIGVNDYRDSHIQSNTNSNKIYKSNNTHDDYNCNSNKTILSNANANVKAKHKLLDFNQFQAIFNDEGNNNDNTVIKTNKNNSYSSRDAPISLQEKTLSPKEPQVNIASPQVNANENKKDSNQKQQESTQSQHAFSEQHSKQFSPLSYQALYQNNNNNNDNDSYTFPFYLISKKELMDNVVDYLFDKPKKINVTYYSKKEKKKL